MICPRRLISCDDFIQQFSFSTDSNKVLRFMATVLAFFVDTYYRVLGLFMGCAPSRNVSEKMDMADDGSNSNCTNCVGCHSCSNCKDCTDSYSCSNCSGCEKCYSCSNCKDCSDCHSCSNCTDCIGVAAITAPIAVG
ncbi:hypothetical protein IQ06DRAFT_355 [Phaeosphaeriaceae sp. SRC1lsM3a]|nr:hypothetical protein IQ06DRAFT_355 [Stagonospora sp. SRC1lsM3a]